MAIETINPTSGQTVLRFTPHDSGAVEAALQRAADAFASWRRRPLAERTALLGRTAQLLREERERLGGLMTLEMGKLRQGALDEIDKCAAGCQHYAEHGQRYLADEVKNEPGGVEERIHYEPLGPVLAVMPWNFPFWQVFRFAAPALVAGNVALLKHAGNVPQCALAIEDLLRRAGAPAGVFQTLLLEADAVEAIIADPRVAAVTLTGSDRAGRAVGGAAGRHLKRSVLELGGSDPFLVLASADLEQAVATAVKARMVNGGQSCIAAKRFIAVAPVYADFRQRFVAAVKALAVGAPDDPATDIGPLATAAIRDGLADQVRRSIDAGTKLLTGGEIPARPGFFYAPTVLESPPPGAPAAREELFGPVATLFQARDTDEAIRLANDTPFGLGASVFTQDRALAERCAREIDTGQVFINAQVASDPRFPFGGVKQSGYGRELGVFGLREFVNVKRVRVTGLP